MGGTDEKGQGMGGKRIFPYSVIPCVLTVVLEYDGPAVGQCVASGACVTSQGVGKQSSGTSQQRGVKE